MALYFRDTETKKIVWTSELSTSELEKYKRVGNFECYHDGCKGALKAIHSNNILTYFSHPPNFNEDSCSSGRRKITKTHAIMQSELAKSLRKKFGAKMQIIPHLKIWIRDEWREIDIAVLDNGGIVWEAHEIQRTWQTTEKYYWRTEFYDSFGIPDTFWWIPSNQLKTKNFNMPVPTKRLSEVRYIWQNYKIQIGVIIDRGGDSYTFHRKEWHGAINGEHYEN